MDLSQRRPPPRFENPGDTARFRELLLRADFGSKAIIRVLGVDELSRIRNSSRPLLLARTGSGGLLDTLIRLFVLRVPVEPAVLAEVIKPMTVESWLRAGLIYPDGPALYTAVELLPYSGLVVLSDRSLDDGAQPSDFVMGLGQTTRVGAATMVRNPSRLSLDLGTGSGVLALLAASFSERVIGTDINPRALAFARFNAEINGVTNAEFIQGGLFEPVKDHRFDLIVSNPPFVIAPANKFMYRDSGMRGDGLVEAVVRGAAQHLSPGGFAQIVCNWAHLKGKDWKARVGGWFEGSGCDALVLAQRVRSAAEYAMLWIDETERGSTQNRFDAFGEWIAFFRELGMEAAENGLITLRKNPERANWFNTDTAPDEPATGSGAHLLQMFKARDFLASIAGDQALLDQLLRPSPAMKIRQDLVCNQGRWEPANSQILLDTGLSYGGAIESGVQAFLLTCDGSRTLREQVAATAAATGRAQAEMTSMCLTLAKHLLERGFLLPPERSERLSSAGNA